MWNDRAQNTCTEVLNLIRKRKGKTQHIVIVTLKPMPSRLASIVLGTGDIDNTYHGGAIRAPKSILESGNEDQAA
ncbi:NgoMIV family type II restriction endonuclease [Neomoorella mulderi]|uniref:NgoMIV family type II restriction endonuclease n=1 Tax=Neomoorella mulderi TaxID=202604 RepID=UPI000A0170DF